MEMKCLFVGYVNFSLYLKSFLVLHSLVEVDSRRKFRGLLGHLLRLLQRGQVVALSAGTDDLSLGELNAAADEDQESVGRI